MNRRDGAFALVVLGAASLVNAQQARISRIGYLTSRAPPVSPNRDAFSDALAAGMRERGFIEGQNLTVEWRYLGGQNAGLNELAMELVRLNVEVIVAYGTAAVQALQRTGTAIPIVIAAAVDPVGSGLVASLARPGGTTTGLSAIAVDLSQKHLELLKAMVPAVVRVALLTNPGNASQAAVTKGVVPAAKALGIDLVRVSARTAAEIGNAFAQAAREKAGAVIVAGDAFFSGQGQLFAATSLKHHLATISIYREHVELGGLMSYGQNIADFHRQSAGYVDKILKGAKPADLPVEQPTRFELVINVKAARLLGISIPQSLLLRADEAIQ